MGGAATQVLEPADALAATNAAGVLAVESTSLVGATIAGRYKVQKKLGEGGMGTVYQALHTVLEKQVALKVLHPELTRKQQLVDRFLQEAKACSRIRHENVIDISDFGAADGHVFFAMELLHGHDLHEEITRARGEGKLLPWTRTKNIFLHICSALSAAHERGIVHRDLKPENIYLIQFLGDPDFVKLLDFGIAKMTDVSGSDEGRKLTKTGMLFGTPEYMAPEQARGETVDHRADVYAMGCILFLLVSNRLPFQADSFMGVLSQHLTDEPPEIAPETFDQIGAPRELAGVIDGALAKDREQRWQTIDELVAAICDVCGDPVPTKGTQPKRAASVPSPGETTRMRTPTDQPVTRSRTPSGPQRAKVPTAPPRLQSTPEKSVWTATLEVPQAVVTLGPIPEPEQKGTMFAIIAGLVVVGALVSGAFLLGWFDGSPKAKKSEPMMGSAVGSGAAAPTPAVATPTPAPVAVEPAPKTTAPVKPVASTKKPDRPIAATPLPDTSTAVTKPDLSTAVTSPDMTPAKPEPEPAPNVEPAAQPPAESAPD